MWISLMNIKLAPNAIYWKKRSFIINIKRETERRFDFVWMLNGSGNEKLALTFWIEYCYVHQKQNNNSSTSQGNMNWIYIYGVLNLLNFIHTENGSAIFRFGWQQMDWNFEDNTHSHKQTLNIRREWTRD